MKLSDYLKSLTEQQREDFAKRAKTTVAYLYQIAGGHRKAGHALAKLIEKESNRSVTKHELRPDIFDPPRAGEDRRHKQHDRREATA